MKTFTVTLTDPDGYVVQTWTIGAGEDALNIDKPLAASMLISEVREAYQKALLKQ